MRRRVFPITAAFALVAAVALSGCTTAGGAGATSSISHSPEQCAAPFGAGALSESVALSGDSAETLRVDLNHDAQVRGAQRSLLVEAEDRSELVYVGAIVAANLAFVDSGTGEIMQISPGFGGERGDSLFIADPEVGTVVAGTLCTAVGDTVAVVLTQAESESMGVESPIVVVAEILGVYDSRAEGKARALPSGFPAVTTDHTGQPGIVLPPQDAPANTQSAMRIEGPGEQVAADDNVVGQVLSVTWDGIESKNTWAQSPESFGTEPEPVASFREQLTGYPVGSQVVVIENGEGGAQVSVVDILAVF